MQYKFAVLVVYYVAGIQSRDNSDAPYYDVQQYTDNDDKWVFSDDGVGQNVLLGKFFGSFSDDYNQRRWHKKKSQY